MIPTSHKSKLPKFLSWPVGAEIISNELAAVPQIDQLKLTFFYYSSAGDSKVKAEPISVIEVKFTHFHRTISSSDRPEYEGWDDENWEIWVHPVPRELKHEIKMLLLSEGFSKIREWLCAERASTWSEGRKNLKLFYDHNGKRSLVYKDEGV